VKGDRKPKHFEFTSQKKGFERFRTKEIIQMVDKLEMAEEALKDALLPFIASMFCRFYDEREVWLKALSVLTELDCLGSLATVSGQSAGLMCRPQFVEDGQQLLELTGMRHPTVAAQTGTELKNFIPNDTLLSSHERILLVTGPNMGGKSTLLRQTAIACVLAQIGCYVPAESFRLSVVDRIFTRIGASDRILEGQSTFFVEMGETKSILDAATSRSLAIVDELGRGTSTFDGYSIANAVLRYLTDVKRCRSLYSTHYHMLLDDFRETPGIGLFHMASKQEEENVTFLYKFKRGECPKSFGINVARMAGLPEKVLQRAMAVSGEFKERLNVLSTKVGLGRA